MSQLLDFNQVSLSFDEKKSILDDLSFQVASDDFIVLLGANGSGKSSLMKLMNRTYHHAGGTIQLEGELIESISAQSLKKKVVTINQFITDSLFLEMTVEENAIIIESSYRDSLGESFSRKIFKAMLPQYLSSFNQKLAHHLHLPVSHLSGGEQQILAFALYLRRDPKLLLLDEHTSALDPKKSDAVMEFISQYLKQKEIACMMTTHQLEYALKYGNRLIAIKEGRIVYDVSGDDKKNLSMTDLLSFCY